MLNNSVKLHQRDRETEREEERATASCLYPENSYPSHSQLEEDKKSREFGGTGERDPRDVGLSCLETANTQWFWRTIPSKITNFIYVQRILSLSHPLFSFKTCPLDLEEIQES